MYRGHREASSELTGARSRSSSISAASSCAFGHAITGAWRDIGRPEDLRGAKANSVSFQSSKSHPKIGNRYPPKMSWRKPTSKEDNIPEGLFDSNAGRYARALKGHVGLAEPPTEISVAGFCDFLTRCRFSMAPTPPH